MIINNNDIELIKKYSQSGEERYLLNLYQKYLKHITAICYNYLGKYDYHQDAAIEIYSKLKKELLDRSFDDKAKFVSWLSVVVKNHCISHLRKLNSIDRTKSNYELIQENMELPEFERNNDIATSDLKEAIQELKENQQKCILYFYFRGYKITEEVLEQLRAENLYNEQLSLLDDLFNKEIRGKGFFFDLLTAILKDKTDSKFIVKIINLAYFSDRMTYKEISQVTGFPLEKVKSYIQNGKLNLKKILKRKINREY